MSKFVVNDYGNKKEILKFPDHYVAVAVTVDDKGVVAENGKKIVPAGTIVGGKNNPVLENLDELVVEKNTVPQYASLVTNFLDNSDDPVDDANLLFKAKEIGVDGNGISIALVDPGEATQTLAVSVSGSDISISLATGADSAITTTATLLKAAIEADDTAKNLVSVEFAEPFAGEAGTGAGVVQAIAKTALAGGVDGTGANAEGVLLNDVDVTYGPAPGAMVIHGFIDLNKIPEEPDEEVNLPQITFLK